MKKIKVAGHTRRPPSLPAKLPVKAPGLEGAAARAMREPPSTEGDVQMDPEVASFFQQVKGRNAKIQKRRGR